MTIQYELIEVPVDYIIEPDSSFIDTVAFDEQGGHTYVVMHGHTYYYEDVPYTDFVRLALAQSPGHEYSTFFRDTYGPADRLDGNFNFVIRQPGGIIEEDEVKEETVEEGDFLEYRKNRNRLEALSLATQVYGSTGVTAGFVLDAARAFERYLDGE